VAHSPSSTQHGRSSNKVCFKKIKKEKKGTKCTSKPKRVTNNPMECGASSSEANLWSFGHLRFSCAFFLPFSFCLLAIFLVLFAASLFRPFFFAFAFPKHRRRSRQLWVLLRRPLAIWHRLLIRSRSRKSDCLVALFRVLKRPTVQPTRTTERQGFQAIAMLRVVSSFVALRARPRSFRF